jgi:hypothetical protein
MGKHVEPAEDDLLERLRLSFAPTVARCSDCRRSVWDAREIGEPCEMPQPNGQDCTGRFEAV